MQVLCKATKGNAETFCCICGLGFVMFWDRQSRAERAAAMHDIQEVLRSHHRTAWGPEAHPTEGFPVPDWTGPRAGEDTVSTGSEPVWGI